MFKKSLLVIGFLLAFVGISNANILDTIKYIKTYSNWMGDAIKVDVFYENSDGNSVVWSGVPLDFKCTVYHNEGTWQEPEEGMEFANKEGTLGSYLQDIIIEIPSWDKYEKSPIVKCEFDIGWPHLESTSVVLPK